MSLSSGADGGRNAQTGETNVVLGEDWVSPDGFDMREDRAKRDLQGRGFFSFNQSPLSRKIITFNLVTILILVVGVLYLNPSRDGMVEQRERGMVTEAELIADVFEAGIRPGETVNLLTNTGLDVVDTLVGLDLPPGLEVFVFAPDSRLIATATGRDRPLADLPDSGGGSTLITDFLNTVWGGLSMLFTSADPPLRADSTEKRARDLVHVAISGVTETDIFTMSDGGSIFTVATPIENGGSAVGVVAVVSASGEIDELVRQERELVLQVFVIAILVSVGLSIVLASTIANPLSDLAAAAEIGRDGNNKKVRPSRVRIPDLSARPDEIGRLSSALRGMVAALYDRIDANEQFAADVAHEIKNPLASLRSAVGTMRVAKKEEQRERLLEVIEHDVRRLDRLVSDISNASRLDSELVKEEEEGFDLLKMMQNLTNYLSEDAKSKGVEFITDMPQHPIMVQGLEARLAQVFVNLITNAISFCGEGDAIRVWVRRRENRVLVVVEDTGPGIPDQALTKIFNRFYSERPAGQFGNNSGLGLAISKQIIEAHDGVIWAENIRPTHADTSTEPLGARFVVGLPV